ncbi:hypothetical protein AB6A40_010113 [Gnathostoma spinigerum]|uniref:ANK_REP_REGION domain-containing protein n=1 Tax=Gnathostoma spinigerum TaxID=75299 RepID=A0ABD6F0W3_9BILA
MDDNFGSAIGAICDGDIVQLEKCLKQSADILKVRRRGRSLLTFAVLNDNVRVAVLLNKRGLSFSEHDANGETALHWAVHADARKCVKHILSLPRKDDETAWILLADRHHITPFHLAAKLGRAKILKVIS